MERLLTLLLLVGLGSALGFALRSASTCPCHPQSRGQAVCGSDQVTYPSQCALQCASENKTDLALLHEGPCEVASAVRGVSALRGVSCATEAENCQKKCGDYIRIYFSCSSDGKSECSCLPGVASCDDEEDKCRAKCSNDFLHFTCSTFRGVAQQTSCTCKSSPTPVRADCGAYGRSCEWTCGSKATNVLCQLDHDNIINKSCTCGADSTTARTTARTPNSADRTQMESTAALACVLLWMKNWMTC